jgi:hypothetical protein
VRRRDRIRDFFADRESPRHDHARRVMESYEKEWLTGRPVQCAIMHIVGLFDRPASGDCVRALRMEPAIEGLSTEIMNLDEFEWLRALARLREVRLLAPPGPLVARHARYPSAGARVVRPVTRADEQVGLARRPWSSL